VVHEKRMRCAKRESVTEASRREAAREGLSGVAVVVVVAVAVAVEGELEGEGEGDVG
jgi:hypothetical protein